MSEELQQMSETVNCTVKDIREATKVILSAHQQHGSGPTPVDGRIVQAPAQTGPPAHTGGAREEQTGGARLQSEQPGAATSVDGFVAFHHEHHISPPTPESIPISVEEFADIKRSGNLQYVWVYLDFPHEVPFKMKVSTVFLSDAREYISRGGGIYPHRKGCTDWDLFIEDRKRWAAKQHFTHCRAKS